MKAKLLSLLAKQEAETQERMLHTTSHCEYSSLSLLLVFIAEIKAEILSNE